MDIRTRILDEAGKLFSRMGIRSITMDYLAQELGISKRTIYENFRDKNEIVLYSILKGLNDHSDDINKIISESPNVIEALYNIGKKSHEVFSKINPVFFYDLKRHYKQINELISERSGINSVDSNLMLLRKGINEGVFNKEINIDLVNVFLQQLMEMFHSDGLNLSGRFSKADIMKSIIRPYLVGICTDKGLALLKQHDNVFDESI
ncbi:MAG: TetR/AcrR family transcriptional regulator [Bacteroidales bacterium]|nr:TetR/AcrR family transcriptional regulator [Bacteroidales bacterium]